MGIALFVLLGAWETGSAPRSQGEAFAAFYAEYLPKVFRYVSYRVGDQHTAEDLTQTTLARMFVSWRRISRQDAVYAYANRTLVNSYLSDRRRGRGREVLTGWVPETAAEPQGCELRMMVLDALATLPPKTRAVVVMRYWADLSVEQVADLLGCSTGNVKSQSARGLDKLRAVLGEDGAPTGPREDSTQAGLRDRRDSRSG